MTQKTICFCILLNVKPFYFYHLLKADYPEAIAFDKILGDTVTWETCLRKIIFTDINIEQHLDQCRDLHLANNTVQNFDQLRHLELLTETEALSFLIEVLCGIRSKVIGETEIFGQFRKFLELDEVKKLSFFQNRQLLQFILQQVKEIRDQYITGLSVNSYGSLIRKKMGSVGEISFIGYGQLAQKIYPWVKNNNVKFHVRDLNKSKANSDADLNFDEIHSNHYYSNLIIVAPIKSEVLCEIIKAQPQIKNIIDCRGLDSEYTSLKQYASNNQIELTELSDLFLFLETEQGKAKEILPQVKLEILNRCQAYYLKVQHRPLGWEDLCG